MWTVFPKVAPDLPRRRATGARGSIEGRLVGTVSIRRPVSTADVDERRVKERTCRT